VANLVDNLRQAAFLSFAKRGISHEDAAVAALALNPLDPAYKGDRRYEKTALKLSRQFGRRIKREDSEEIVADARAMLAEYKRLAVIHGEPYYAQRYDRALGLEE